MTASGTNIYLIIEEVSPMPKIIQEDKRVAALNEIEASLAVIRSINAALVEENSYIVTAVCSDRG